MNETEAVLLEALVTLEPPRDPEVIRRFQAVLQAWWRANGVVVLGSRRPFRRVSRRDVPELELRLLTVSDNEGVAASARWELERRATGRCDHEL